MNLPLSLNLLALLALLLGLAQTRRTDWSLAKKVLLGLVLGVLFGFVLHSVYRDSDPVLKATLDWLDLIGKGYVQLLLMIVMPLIFASILSAVARLHDASSLGRISVLSIGTLLLTTAIAALVGVMLTNAFGLSTESLISGNPEMQHRFALQAGQENTIPDLNIPKMLLSFIPSNPVGDLARAKPTSIISVVIFAVFLGLAALQLGKDDPVKGQRVLNAIDTLQAWVMRLVRLVMKLTPYGVLALMASVVASSNLYEILNVGMFVLVSYLGLGLMFVVHGLILAATGVNPLRFLRKVLPVLTFAFTSRSSAASIPLNIEAQTQRLGVPQAIASFCASFGATIGQNGCAGLYPAMLAVMVAPALGIDTFDPLWIATLVAVVTLSSAGIAGVGGGAIIAAMIVLPAMGLPVETVALLFAVEPLIDMGRTALNVNGSMTAGMVTSQLLKQTDHAVLQADEHTALSQS